jgi:hypothetical protein
MFRAESLSLSRTLFKIHSQWELLDILYKTTICRPQLPFLLPCLSFAVLFTCSSLVLITHGPLKLPEGRISVLFVALSTVPRISPDA